MRIQNIFIAAAVTLVLQQTVARAHIVHFTNPAPGQPGHYDWRFAWQTGWQSWLDITRGPQEQTNIANGNSVAQGFQTAPTPNVWYNSTSAGGASVARTSTAPVYTLNVPYGDEIAGLTYSLAGVHVYMTLGFPGAILNSEFLLEESGYIAVRTQSGNYGWIEVQRTLVDTPQGVIGMNLTALSWAYESEPNVSIYAGQIPAPGAIGMFCAAVVVGSFRRRRR